MTDDLIDSLGLGATDPTRVVTGTIVDATPDAATVTFSREGNTVRGILSVGEYYRGRPFVVGESMQMMLLPGVAGTPQLSVVRPELVAALFAGVSPEVREGTVRIMAVARRAHMRSKVAVAATAEGIDAVAACVGRSSNRVDAVRAALGGEQVDIVAWHEDPSEYLANCLQPAQVLEVAFDPAGRNAVAVVPPHQMSAAVGGGGLNSALAGELSKVKIRIVSG